jgi:hypothetical protein
LNPGYTKQAPICYSDYIGARPKAIVRWANRDVFTQDRLLRQIYQKFDGFSCMGRIHFTCQSDEYHPLLPSFIRLQGPSAEGASCASRDTSMHNRLNKPGNLERSETPLLASFTRKPRGPHTEFHFVIWHIFGGINKRLNLAILTKSICSRALQSSQPDNPNKASRERQF